MASTYLGVVRVLLLPFYLRWWRDQTSPAITGLLFVLWALQLAALHVYFNYDIGDNVPAAEVMTPLIMFIIIAAIQSQIASSHRTPR